MPSKTVSVVIFTLLSLSMLTLAFNIHLAEAETINVPDDYPTIQGAISHSNEGDIIFVRNGTYSGPIVIDRTLTLQGEHRNAAIIDGGTNEPSGSIVLVAANNVKISGFTIQHCRGGGNAVYLDGYVNMAFSDNIITGCNEGVRILHSSGNVVSYNIVQDCYYNTGVGFDWSYNNIVYHNTIIHNHYGLSGGYDNHDNTYSENTIINNDIGFGTNMYDDKFFHNNFVNNGVHVIANGTNQFDDGYPSGGNYWSDYTGQDLDKDGIGDTPYTINDRNKDRYPFMQQDSWRTSPPPAPKSPLGLVSEIALIVLDFLLNPMFVLAMVVSVLVVGYFLWLRKRERSALR